MSDEPDWTPPQTTKELVERYPGLVEKLVLQILLKLQHNRLHANDQAEDVAQAMFILLDKPSGKSHQTLLQQFELARCPKTPEAGWKNWLWKHVLLKRIINLLKEEGRKGKFHQTIHEDVGEDESAETIPVAQDASPLDACIQDEAQSLGSSRVDAFCSMLRDHPEMDVLPLEERETLIQITRMQAEGASKGSITEYLGGPTSRYTLAMDYLAHFWTFFEEFYFEESMI